MKALFIGYSFTGQAREAMRIASATATTNGVESTQCFIDFAEPSLRLRRPMKPADVKRWTREAQDGATHPICLSPRDALHQRYDFVGLFSNTWQMHPSVPVRSLLAMPQMQQLLSGTAFAVYVICRRLWENNARLVQSEAEQAGGRCVGVEAFTHGGGPIGSLVRTVSYLMTSGPPIARIGGLRLPLPAFGLSEASLARVPTFTLAALSRAQTDRATHASAHFDQQPQ